MWNKISYILIKNLLISDVILQNKGKKERMQVVISMKFACFNL